MQPGERRLTPRLKLRIPISIRRLDSSNAPPQLVESSDISARGFYFATRMPLQVGTAVQVTLRMQSAFTSSRGALVFLPKKTNFRMHSESAPISRCRCPLRIRMFQSGTLLPAWRPLSFSLLPTFTGPEGEPEGARNKLHLKLAHHRKTLSAGASSTTARGGPLLAFSPLCYIGPSIRHPGLHDQNPSPPSCRSSHCRLSPSHRASRQQPVV